MINTNSKDGFEAEFAFLVKEYEYALRIFAFRVTKCEQLAKDVVQEVFLKLWEHRETFNQIENAGAWLYRVTENKLIDHLRKVAADKRLRQKTWNSIRNNSNETEIALSAKESEHLILKAIESLPEQRKKIYRLNREQLLNYNQIAQTLRISKHTVKNQLSSALQNLRERLKGLRFF
jgi:RNA polymerase sigma-70 factor (family 1)